MIFSKKCRAQVAKR